jgi:diaminohydroxyphosphoribosylaminopyrimidine deaminase / 5-amino-6-(5-phosphoribosylamino)uracil reductase
MARALELARRGEALASPNPMVGAVLVRDAQVIGEAFHTYDGLHHAEILALEAAGDRARGATLYVNLEPCCHTGRTGPCTRALVSAGLSRVVAAMPDPNPQIAGRGFKELRAAGIEVECLDSPDEARRLNEAFALWITAHRPFVTLKAAMTLDGSLVLPPTHPRGNVRTPEKPGSGKRHQWITSEAARAEVQRMRHASDAIMTGIGTVLADDPLLTDRTGLPRRRRLLRVVLDSRLRLSPSSQLVRTADNDVVVFTCASESSPRAKMLRRAGVEVFECEPSRLRGEVPGSHGKKVRVRERGGRPDLKKVLAELGRREILSVILEAGAILSQAALDANVVEKVRLFYAPTLAGNLLPLANGRAARGEVPGSHGECGKKRGSFAGKHAKSASRGNRTSRLRHLSDLRIDQFGPDFAVEAYLRDVYQA